MNLPAVDAGTDVAQLEATHRRGAQWFYWLAGLTIVNSIAIHLGSKWTFALGLGTSVVVDVLFTQAAIVALCVNAAICLACIGVGVLAGQRMVWAFVLGLVLYSFDALVSLLIGDWLGLALHAWVIYCWVTALRAASQLNRLANTSH